MNVVAMSTRRGEFWFLGMRYFLRSEIDQYGMCKEEPDRECRTSCSKFMRAECPGTRIIRTEDPTLWIDQKYHPFPLYAKLKEAEE